ncbi:DoxX family protein [Pectobacterium parmentieri]|uniref:DoxX family protein n=1 Tax=Pectobacterium parmentieri TaxID=1905730 RepID=A0A0H3IB60_PECPM|nr:DoxX family protein [Pectobacterium parmentieri]AFI91148.1 Putative inner membrane protein YqjF [Pectobacterium parmentieri]AOR57933.1 LysR family transcriptional regulator [Pectobacterium parmentieri]AYH02233.1 DoxX family protein [Pectobacterium parmentieri]AYH06495.1 DoxX family protein [Pectobacterium parmentieri]AYH11050.1 DoxX family protein [Pectobacterium parmentieri]
MEKNASIISTIGRALIAIVFVLSGLSKIGASEATQGYITSVGLPFPLLGYLIALVVEIGGGILLLIGYHTRVVALVLSAFTVATAVFFHHNFADQNAMINFLKNIIIVGGLLQIVAFGPSKFSLDARRH